MKKKRIQIIISELIILICLFYFVNSKYLKIIPPCWVHHTTGLFCPACGGTRCVISILKGDWMHAFFSHMVFCVGVVYLLIVNIVYLINLDKKNKVATWIYPKYWYIIIFAIVLIIYTIVRNLL